MNLDVKHVDVKVVQFKIIFIEEKILNISLKEIREVEVDQEIDKNNYVVRNVVKDTQKIENHVYVVYQNIKEEENYHLMVVKIVVVMDVMIEIFLMILIQVHLKANLENQV